MGDGVEAVEFSAKVSSRPPHPTRTSVFFTQHPNPCPSPGPSPEGTSKLAPLSSLQPPPLPTPASPGFSQQCPLAPSLLTLQTPCSWHFFPGHPLSFHPTRPPHPGVPSSQRATQEKNAEGGCLAIGSRQRRQLGLAGGKESHNQAENPVTFFP